MRRTAALIVGGGPAGAAAALLLARAGAPHLLVERDRITGDALCGGFLSWRTLETLARLDVSSDALNRARITRVRLFAGGRSVEAPLPRAAIGVSRHRLDALLLDRAAAAGAAIERGVAIRALDGLSARTDDGATIAADAVLLASGKHDLRGAARPVAARGDDPALGLRVRLAPSPALDRLVADAIELHLFAGGYAGLNRQEDGSGNLCLAVQRSVLRAAGTPAALLATLAATHPALGERLAHMAPAPAIDAVANVPYGWRATDTDPGLFRLGDQAAVIPSLAGEGMGIALASGIAAARTLIAGGPAAAPDYQRRFARRVARPLAVAGRARDLAQSPAAARVLPWLVRIPGAIALLARATRVPDRAW